MSKLVQLKRIVYGAWGGAPSRQRLWESGGEDPSRWSIYWKNSYFNAIWIIFPRFQSHLKVQNF